jgi:hypothetical protein
MTAPTIPALPSAPDRTSPGTTFSADAAAFIAALPGLVADLNALGAWLNSNALLSYEWGDGSAAAPSVHPASDDMLGMYFSENQLGFAVAGVMRALLSSTAFQIDVPITGDAVVGTVSQSGGESAGALFEVGSNANGTYIRFAGGIQLCWFEATLPYSAANVCLTTWTYPAAFIAAPDVIGNASAIATATPIESELNPIRMNSIGATTVQVRQSRISGMTNFQPGDTVTAKVMAVGSWV